MKKKRQNKDRNFGGLIVVLCLLVVVCVAVLAGVAHKNDTDTTTESQPVVQQQTENTTEATTTEPTTTEPTTEVTTTEKIDEGKKVYATTTVNIRKGPGVEYETVGQLKTGESVKIVSEGENGWSEVEYNGENCYISSKYLADEEPTTEEVTEANRTVVDPTEGDWQLVVVNAYREYDKNYEPKLKKILPDSNYEIYMDYRVADSFTEMYNAAKKDGITLTPVSGYRSYERQETNYKNRIALWQSKGYSYNEAVAKTSEVILPPGTSEHNLGLAMDICCLDYDFDETKEYEWLDKNAHKYGFILRYTEEWKSHTGVVGEPWHWRYVGEHAEDIKESGLCLEEYVAKLKAS